MTSEQFSVIDQADQDAGAIITEEDVFDILTDVYMENCGEIVEFQNLGGLSQLTCEILEADPEFQGLLKVRTEVDELINARLSRVIHEILTECRAEESEQQQFAVINEDRAFVAAAS